MTSTGTPVVRQVKVALEQIRHPQRRPLVVALSGGVDSQVLTHALKQVTTEMDLSMQAVHVDHGLRKASADDARRVKELCGKWEIDCEIAKVDVAAWDAELRQGTESAARAARYAALARAAANAGTDTVVTGHTMDDQAETVILRLISGSGLEGLGGMDQVSRRPVRLDPGRKATRRIALFRPMLGLKRSEIEEYAHENAIEPIEDESNQSLAFRRNAIRQNVIPAMEQIETGTRDAISRTSSLLREDARFINDTVDETFSEVVAERAGVWMIERQQFRLAYQAIQRRILYRVVEPLLPASARITRERIESLRHAAVDADPGKIIELADGIVGYVDYDRLAIGEAENLESNLRRLSWIPLMEPGTEIPLSGHVDVSLDNGWRVRGEAPEESGLTLRTRRDGDRTRGERGRGIKLQDWLVDRKVPRYVRDWLPVVSSDSEIHWIIGLDVTEFSDSRRDVHLHVELDTSSPRTQG